MRIFIAGATGTLGRPTTEALLKQGHEVIAMTRDAKRAAPLAKAGVEIEVADVYDAPRLRDAMLRRRPDALLHLLTDLPRQGVSKAKDVASTNRIRTEGTRNLIDAARAAGVNRIVAESYLLAYGVGDFGAAPLAEDALPAPPKGAVGDIVRATRELESQVVGAGGVALRFASFMGAGVPSFDAMKQGLAAGKVPIVGRGDNVLPFVRLDDAMDATLAALQAPPGVYNVADDRYPTVGELFPRWAQQAGGKPPRRVPPALARLLAPFGARFLGTNLRMSTAKARAHLGWKPRPAP